MKPKLVEEWPNISKAKTQLFFEKKAQFWLDFFPDQIILIFTSVQWQYWQSWCFKKYPSLTSHRVNWIIFVACCKSKRLVSWNWTLMTTRYLETIIDIPYAVKKNTTKLFFVKKVFGGHMSFLGTTGTPVLDFWWHLLWGSKPESVLPYSLFFGGGKCNVHSAYPPLVLHMPTSWRAAAAASHFPTCISRGEKQKKLGVQCYFIEHIDCRLKCTLCWKPLKVGTFCVGPVVEVMDGGWDHYITIWYRVEIPDSFQMGWHQMIRMPVDL